MADNGEGGGEKPRTDITELRQQVLTLVSRNFQGAAEKPIDEVASRVLTKRRKKWRKRHNLTSEVGARPPDPGLRSEKEQLTEQFYQCGERLLVCRRSGYSLARQLERDKRRLQLQVAERYKHTETQLSLDPGNSEQSASSEPSERDRIILKDLQRAISQADALVKVKKMKLSMTPRLPPLHRREVADNTTSNDQFGMSLLVPPHQVMEKVPSSSSSTSSSTSSSSSSSSTSLEHRPSNEAVDSQERNRTLAEGSQLLRSPGNGAAAEDAPLQQRNTNSNVSPTTAASNSTAEAEGEGGRPSLDPAVELAPIMRETVADEEEGDTQTEDPPRVACVMSLMEGQDTASVVEVTADNDEVIETNSSLFSDEKSDVTEQPPEPSYDDRLLSTNILPEKEEIVSTMPEGFNEEVEVESEPFTPPSPPQELPLPLPGETNHHSESSSENHRDYDNHHMEEELVEMILRDSELAAWIAKARLRPRTPISYKMTRKRRSRSRSSSILD